MEESDRAIIDQCLRGQTARYAVLVERYQRQAYRYALRRCGSPQEAESLSIEAFAKAYSGLPGFNGRASFATWLFRILINTCNTHLAKRGRDARFLTPLDDSPAARMAAREAGPAQMLLDGETAVEIRRAVHALPDTLRDTWILFALDERSINEIAEIQDATPGAIKSRLFQARKKLQATLSPYLEGKS